MKISLIIPTYNAASYLPTLLDNLKNQSLSHELIIIDSSSKDDTVAIAKAYTEHIIVIPQSEFDHGGTRTQAAKIATGDILIYLTQDALPHSPKALELLVASFDDPQVAAVCGRQVPYEDATLFGKHLRHFNYPAHSHTRTMQDKEIYGIKMIFLSDSFAAYRKEVLEAVDWFKHGLIIGEDSHVASKMLAQGHAIAYNAQAMVYHSHSYTLVEEFRRYFDTGVFHAQEKEIFAPFKKAEGEGGKYVKSELNYLLSHHAYHKIPEFFVRNAMKLLGYKLGLHYTSLPRRLSKKLSLQSYWWKA